MMMLTLFSRPGTPNRVLTEVPVSGPTHFPRLGTPTAIESFG
jgi:hypothetical protein